LRSTRDELLSKFYATVFTAPIATQPSDWLVQINRKEEIAMACITLMAPMTMATTQLARVIHHEDVLEQTPKFFVK
jgi:hypothetical protein